MPGGEAGRILTAEPKSSLGEGAAAAIRMGQGVTAAAIPILVTSPPGLHVAVPNKWHDAGQKGTPSPSALLLPDLQTQPEAGRGTMAIVLSLLETTVSQRAPSDTHDTE